jgi:hypothetical protein
VAKCALIVESAWETPLGRLVWLASGAGRHTDTIQIDQQTVTPNPSSAKRPQAGAQRVLGVGPPLRSPAVTLRELAG